jgi:hypothetical protein
VSNTKGTTPINKVPSSDKTVKPNIPYVPPPQKSYSSTICVSTLASLSSLQKSMWITKSSCSSPSAPSLPRRPPSPN